MREKYYFSPNQIDNQWKEYTDKETHRQCYPPENVGLGEKMQKSKYGTFLDKEKLELAVEKKLVKAENLSYFNNLENGSESTRETQHAGSSFDRLFHGQTNYNQKLHRDDRAAKFGLNVHKEEISKNVPILSSSVYGRLPSLEPNERNFVKIAVATKGFFSNRGTGIPLHGE